MAETFDLAREVKVSDNHRKWENAHDALQDAPLNQVFYIEIKSHEFRSAQATIMARSRERGYQTATRLENSNQRGMVRLYFQKTKMI